MPKVRSEQVPQLTNASSSWLRHPTPPAAARLKQALHGLMTYVSSSFSFLGITLSSSDRRQETGDRRQETGDRRQETGDRRQEIFPLSTAPCALLKSSVCMEIFSMNDVTVSKLESAERHLLQSIRWFFEGSDPLCIHTNISSAIRMLEEYYNARGEGFKFFFMAGLRDNGVKPYSPKNFCSHAKKDCGKTLSFNTARTEIMIMEGISWHNRHTLKWAPECLVFSGWFGQKYKEYSSDSSNNFISGLLNDTQSYDWPDPSDKLAYYRLIPQFRSDFEPCLPPVPQLSSEIKISISIKNI